MYFEYEMHKAVWWIVSYRHTSLRNENIELVNASRWMHRFWISMGIMTFLWDIVPQQRHSFGCLFVRANIYHNNSFTKQMNKWSITNWQSETSDKLIDEIKKHSFDLINSPPAVHVWRMNKNKQKWRIHCATA